VKAFVYCRVKLRDRIVLVRVEVRVVEYGRLLVVIEGGEDGD